MSHYSYPPRDHDSGGWDSNSPYLGRATPPPHTPDPNRWLYAALVTIAVLALGVCIIGAVFATHDSSNQPTTPPTATTTG